jgi:hypothetical protein
MAKFYEVTDCTRCPCAKLTGAIKICRMHKSQKELTWEIVMSKKPPAWCPLPDMPISKMETTTSAKGGD